MNPSLNWTPPASVGGSQRLHLERTDRKTTDEGIPFSELRYTNDPAGEDPGNWATFTTLDYQDIPNEMIKEAVSMVNTSNPGQELIEAENE